jgi:phosphonate transport system permease protein
MTLASPRPSITSMKTPSRFERPNPVGFILFVVALAFIIWSFQTSGLSFEQLERGVPAVIRVVGQMFPPDVTNLDRILWSLLTTFQMAIAGVVLGLILSLPIAILAAEGLSPHPLVRHAARSLIALFRTVPDLVWALIFVITVGLGPPAGILTIMVDTIGFAGRFFAEAMEETDKGSREALTAIGAKPSGIVFSSVIPHAMPSFIATSLFCVEKAVRASVVLGLVGAGGIGVELKVAFDLFEYDVAATIIIVIFLLVITVEQFGAWMRRRLI